MKKVRLSDIASELNVSVATVHRALCGSGRVSSETRQRIIDAAKRMGYAPNVAARSLSSKSKIRFAVICTDNDFYRDILNAIEAAAQKYVTIDIKFDFMLTKHYSPIEQAEVLKKILEEHSKYTAIAIAPAHPLLLSPILQELKEKGIGIVTFDNDAPESGRSVFIGPNGYISGKLCAQLYDLALPDNAEVALLTSYVSAIGLNKRIEGFRDEGINSSLRLIGPFEYVDTEEEAYKFCKQILSSHSPNAVFCNSMLGTLGCARAIKEYAQNKVFFIGFDFNEKIKEYIQDGTLFATIYNYPASQGSKITDNLISLFVSNTIALDNEEIYSIPSSVIMRSNLQEYTSDSQVPINI